MVERQAEVLQQVRRDLLRQLESVGSAVMFGTVLARSARIEGAYGRSFAPQLTQVSEEFAGTIAAIGQALENLKKAPASRRLPRPCCAGTHTQATDP